MQPVRRATARVLPVSPDGAVLLLRELDPAHPEQPYWASIGGGVEPGESLSNAATRELREETGIDVLPEALSGPVHQMEHAFTWNRQDRLGHHSYFVLPLSREARISFEGLEPEEVDTVLGAEWWTPGDLATDGGFREPGLPAVMQAAIDAVGGQS